MLSQYGKVVFIHSDQMEKTFPSTRILASSQSRVSLGPYGELYFHREETWNLEFVNAP